jgi:hypothetical protein
VFAVQAWCRSAPARVILAAAGGKVRKDRTGARSGVEAMQ